MILLVMMLDQPLLGEAPVLTRSDGLILLLLFSIFVYITVADALDRRQDPLLETVRGLGQTLRSPSGINLKAGWIYIGFGILGLGLGGHMSVVYGSEFAHNLGVSPVIIGMLVVGVGTSLPELVTSIIAANRGECDLCVGNVVGSNIFNSLVVLPIAALVRPLPIPAGSLMDVAMALLATAVIVPVFILGRARMGRITALAFVASFVGYMWLRVSAG
jgi:cation:H+ antiporter